MQILVLEHLAHHYPQFLQHLPDKITYAKSLDNIENQYDVLLAQPDLAAQFLGSGGQTQWIQSTWAGIRPLVEPCADKPILVTGIKDLFGAQIAEYVFTYILEELRTPGVWRQAQRESQWQPRLPESLAGKQLTLVGTGSIGGHVAKVAGAFGMRVTGVSKNGRPREGFDQMFSVQAIERAVAHADYVVFTLPDTEAATDVCDASVFAAMRRQPLFFNVGRGSSVVEDDVMIALQQRQIRGAVLDVFTREPLPTDHAFWHTPNMTITPHIAAASLPMSIAEVFLRNLNQFKHAKPLDFVVDLQRGY